MTSRSLSLATGVTVFYLSISKEATRKYPTEFETIKVSSWSEVAKIATTRRWSPIIWHEGQRRGENFQGSYFAALDVDDGLTLAESLTFLDKNGIGHVVVTTKSHQKAKEKEGPRDRFRVIMLWSREIIKASEYSYNIKRLAQSWEADRSATDLARVFQPGRAIVSLRQGDKINVASEPMRSKCRTFKDAFAVKGRVKRFASEFIESGRLDSTGGRKRTIYSVACELSKSGIGANEAVRMILSAPISWQGIPQATVHSIVQSAQRRFHRG